MQLEHPEFLCSQQNKRLRHVGELGHEDRENVTQVGFGLPAAGNGVEGVGLGAVKAEQLCRQVPVDGEGGAQAGHAAKRAVVKRAIPVVEAQDHAANRFGIGG